MQALRAWGESTKGHLVAPTLGARQPGTTKTAGSHSGSGGHSCPCRADMHLPRPTGKSNPYCEISLGSQTYTTRTLQDTLSPKWNFTCQFFLKDLHQDVLCLTVFDRDQFSPDGKG